MKNKFLRNILGIILIAITSIFNVVPVLAKNTNDIVFSINGVGLVNPQTGDNIMTFVIIGAISIIGLVGCGIYIYKKKY